MNYAITDNSLIIKGVYGNSVVLDKDEMGELLIALVKNSAVKALDWEAETFEDQLIVFLKDKQGEFLVDTGTIVRILKRASAYFKTVERAENGL